MKIINKVTNCPTIAWNIIKTWEFNQLKDNSNRDVKKLKNSIVNNGFIAPFDAWRNPDGRNYIIDGTGRNLALLQLETEGIDIPELPVLFIDAKDLKEAKKFALQRSSQHGQITQSSLADFTSVDFEIEELKELASEEFNLESLDYMLDNLGPEILPDEEADNDVPPLSKETKVIEGDIFEFKVKDNYYRFGCGDSTNIDFVEKVLEEEKVNHIITDPPYNLLDHKLETGIDYQEFYNTCTYFIEKGFLCFFGQYPTLYNFIQPFIQGDVFDYKNEIIWDKKTTSNPMLKPLRVHENIFLFSKGGCQYNDVTISHEQWLAEADYNKLEILKRQLSFWKGKAEGKKLKSNAPTTLNKNDEYFDYLSESKNTFQTLGQQEYQVTTIWTEPRDSHANRNKDQSLHPTQKPIYLLQRLIEFVSDNNQNILDLFLGSGSTIIACIQTQRNCIGCEINPHYINVIIQRIKNYLDKNNLEYSFFHKNGQLTINDLCQEE